MADPSLLPPAMRKREARERAARDAEVAVDFHIPADDASALEGPSEVAATTKPPTPPARRPRVRVSLMPGAGGLSFEAEAARRRKIVIITMVTAIVGGLIVAAGSVGLVSARGKEIRNLKSQLAALEAGRNAEEDMLAGFGALTRTLEVAPKLMDAHVDPIPLLAELERKTIPTVIFNTITLRADTVTVEMIAPDYATAARQVESYHGASEIFANVAAPSYRETDRKEDDTRTDVRFQVTLTLRPGALTFK